MKTKIIHLLFCASMLLSCSDKNITIGSASVSYNGNEILVTNFPHPTQGTSSLYGESFGSFSFDELDKYVYKIATNSSQNTIYITIQFSEKDDHGNVSQGKQITIGAIDVNDSKKFADFSSWKGKYGTYKMWNKDKRAYEEKYLQHNQGSGLGFSIIPAYEPESIK